MKQYLIIVASGLLAFGCNSARPVATNTTNTAAPAINERPQTQIAHGDNPQMPAGNTTSHWKQSGEPIETKELDTAIAAAEVAQKKAPSDEALKKKLGDAYYKRAMALTDAKQYASALGDFRRTVKYDPSNTDAKEWVDKIIMIYDSMGRSYPAEGEEPPPLEKGKQ
jgi:tetratricopeptide (TPR) repeat protein